MKPFEEQSYYELLEISPSASEDEILAAVMRSEAVFAPDSVALYALENPARVEVLRSRLKQAFEVLSDPKQRAEYDQQLAAGTAAHSEMVGVHTSSQGFGELSPDATWEERAAEPVESAPPGEEEPFEPMPSLFQAYRSAPVEQRHRPEESEDRPLEPFSLEPESRPAPDASATESRSQSAEAGDGSVESSAAEYRFAAISSAESSSAGEGSEGSSLAEAGNPSAESSLAESGKPASESSSPPLDLASPRAAVVGGAGPQALSQEAESPGADAPLHAAAAAGMEDALPKAGDPHEAESSPRKGLGAPGIDQASRSEVGGGERLVPGRDPFPPHLEASAAPGATGPDDTQRSAVDPVPMPPAGSLRERVIASLELVNGVSPEDLRRDTLPEGLPAIRLPPPDAATEATPEPPPPTPAPPPNPARSSGPASAPRVERVIMSDGGPVLITPRPSSERIPPSPARRGLRSLQKDAQQIASDNAIPLAETALAQVRARVSGGTSGESRPRMLDIPADAEFNGELLRQIRKSRGLNIQQLADKTRISLKHLENIEADRYDALPATVYLRGFLTSISREFGLDAIRVSKSYLGLVQRHKGSQ